jgi:DNA mismatch repair protein MutL
MNLKDIIYGVYGRDTANSLIELDGRTQDIKMSGFIGRPVIVRGNRSYENYYINGRYIKSSIITKAIEDAYKGFIMPHNYPFTAIHFTIEPDIIDVNVHPQKMELRFSKNNYVYDFVYATIVGALKNMDLAVAVKLEEKKPQDAGNTEQNKNVGRETGNKPNYEVNKIVSSVKEKAVETQTNDISNVVKKQNDVKETGSKLNYEINKIISPVNQTTVKPQTTKHQENVVSAPNEKKREERLPEPFELKRSQQMIAEDSAKYEAVKSESRQMGLFTDSFLNENSKDKYRIIGQLFETYWLVEFEDKFYMMDQHAAHEKVIYERLVKKIRASEADTQMIMPPVIVELNMKEQQVLEDNVDVFRKIGFELENFGGKTYKITGVPANLPNIDYMQMFTELIDNMAEESSFGFELLAERVATMSCKAAIKGNNKISYEEAKELIYELSQAENPFNCPHGRPTLIVMTKYEIERKFKRIV